MTRSYIFFYGLILIFTFSFIFFAFYPLPAHAQGLVQCGLQYGANKDICTICDLISLLQNLVNKAVAYFAAPIAALMIAYGGFLYVWAGVIGGNPQGFTKGTKVLTNTMIGIIILIAAWLLIDTVLKTIGAYQYGGSSFGPWNVIQCESEKISAPTQPPAGVPPPVPPPPPAATQIHYRCIAKACVETTLSSVRTDNCRKGHNEDCAGTVEVDADYNAAKVLQRNDIAIDGNGDCADASGRKVSALTNFQEMLGREPLTVCSNKCSTPCSSAAGITANATMMQDLAALSDEGLRFKINSIATGSHEKGSDHYQGNAVDIKATSGTSYTQLERELRALNKSGQIRLIQCENSAGTAISCGSGSQNITHLHVSYK